MKKSSVLRLLVVIALIVGTVGVVDAVQGKGKKIEIYTVFVDKDGNMRLATGKHAKPKKGEEMIELPSSELITILQGKYEDLQGKIIELVERVSKLENQQSNFTITSTAGTGGSISPSGTVTVAPGASQTFTITADTGYHIADVLVDDSSEGALSTYTFSAVAADHTIEASFASDIVSEGLVLYLPLYELDGTSFMSKDAYGHLCTVTGALRRPNGRYFDGTDDRITFTEVDAGSTSTLIFWVKFDALVDCTLLGNDGNYQNKVVHYSAAADRLFFRADTPTQSGYIHWAPAGLTTGWACVTITQNGQSATLYMNGISKGAGALDSRQVLTTTRLDRIGEASDGTGDFAGMFGELSLYNRILTAGEKQHYYLATKWRYE